MGGQRSFLPGRAQGETRVAPDVSPRWGDWPLGALRSLPVSTVRRRIEQRVGRAQGGWAVWVSEIVSGSAQKTGSVRGEAIPG